MNAISAMLKPVVQNFLFRQFASKEEIVTHLDNFDTFRKYVLTATSDENNLLNPESDFVSASEKIFVPSDEVYLRLFNNLNRTKDDKFVAHLLSVISDFVKIVDLYNNYKPFTFKDEITNTFFKCNASTIIHFTEEKIALTPSMNDLAYYLFVRLFGPEFNDYALMETIKVEYKEISLGGNEISIETKIKKLNTYLK